MEVASYPRCLSPQRLAACLSQLSPTGDGVDTLGQNTWTAWSVAAAIGSITRATPNLRTRYDLASSSELPRPTRNSEHPYGSRGVNAAPSSSNPLREFVTIRIESEAYPNARVLGFCRRTREEVRVEPRKRKRRDHRRQLLRLQLPSLLVLDFRAHGQGNEVLDRPPRPDAPLGIYVHIPFCRKRCHFCYFKVYTDKDSARSTGISMQSSANSRCIPESDVSAAGSRAFIYFGGGTPSFLSTGNSAASWMR